MKSMKTILQRLTLPCILLTCQIGFGQELKILANHIGYEQDGPKHAIVLGREADEVKAFKVIDCTTGKEVVSGAPVKAGPVHQWKDWYFWTIDFNQLTNAGTYLIECATGKGAVRSSP